MKKLLILIPFCLLVSCTNNDKHISGAGASFPAPFYNAVFISFSDSMKINLSYGAIGSGGGVRSLKDKTIDFAASDAYLSDKELSKMDVELIHIPTVTGAIVMAYNLVGVDSLRLNADIISKIYRAEINTWNHPLIAEVNPSLKLPDKEITPVYRSDGSGTTFVFSDYMSQVDEVWKKEIGAAKAINVKKGIAAKGNPGVAGIIVQTDGSIGFIGSEYASALDMTVASIRNQAGNYIQPNFKSISLAANTDIPSDTRKMISNSPYSDAYPIATFTWLIAYKEQAYNNRSIKQAKNLANLFRYMVGEEGQDIAKKTHYAPLPSKVKLMVDSIVCTITYNGKKLDQYEEE